LSTPVCAFITFETDNGKQEALDYTKNSKSVSLTPEMALRPQFPQETLFNRIPKFKAASDPSDIIWENRCIQKHVFR
jgi:hypothetical protein